MAAKNLSDTISRLKDSFVDSGQGDYSRGVPGPFSRSQGRKRVNLFDRANVCKDKFVQGLEANGITVYNKLDRDINMDCDPTLVDRILENAVSNSIKALMFKASGRREIFIQSDFVSDAFRLHVIDNGPGVEPGYQDLIFEPFFTTNQTNSMGLGLSIVYESARDLDGGAKAESKWGERFELIIESSTELERGSTR